MKQPGVLLKVAAVVSSLLLLGGFVCYRAGAFTWLGGLGGRPQPTSSPGLEEKEEPTPVAQPELFYGSKSGRIFPHDAGKSLKPQPSAAQPTPTLMGGSKTIILAKPSLPTTPTAPPAAPGQPAKRSP